MNVKVEVLRLPRGTGLEERFSRLAVRSTQPVNLGCHNEIAFGQAVNLVGPQSDAHLAPSEQNIGMMAFLLRDLTDAIYKCERLLEIWKTKLAVEMMFVGDLPVRNLLVKSYQCSSLESRYTARAWHAFLVSKLFGHGFPAE